MADRPVRRALLHIIKQHFCHVMLPIDQQRDITLNLPAIGNQRYIFPLYAPILADDPITRIVQDSRVDRRR
jgi:hypothetical protein